MNIYDLTSEYINLLAMAEDPDVDIDELSSAMDEINGEIGDKADGYAFVVQRINSDIDSISAEIKRLQERKKAFEARAERIKETLMKSMNAIGRKKIQTANHTFTVAKNGGKIPVVISPFATANDVPDEFRNVKYDFNKDAIREALEAGEILDFAELGERGESLRIK